MSIHFKNDDGNVPILINTHVVIKIHIALVTYFDSRKPSASEHSDRQIRLNNVDPDQTAPSSMIRVFCLHLLGPLPYGRTTLLKVCFWDVQTFLGSLQYFYRSSLKSCTLIYIP